MRSLLLVRTHTRKEHWLGLSGRSELKGAGPKTWAPDSARRFHHCLIYTQQARVLWTHRSFTTFGITKILIEVSDFEYIEETNKHSQRNSH